MFAMEIDFPWFFSSYFGRISTVTGPRTIGGLILNLNDLGPTPLISIYYDMSYGPQSQPLLIIDSSMESAPALQNPIRWLAPKAAPFRVKYDIPPLLETLIELFLPNSLEAERRELERDSIISFIKELNQLRRENSRRGFTDSTVLYNVSSLSVSYPFVSIDDCAEIGSFSISDVFETIS